MKALLLIALVTLGGVSCGPVSIRDNNFGDFTAIGMNIDGTVQGDLNINIANIILALLVNIGGGGGNPQPPVGPQPPPTTTSSPPEQTPSTVLPPITPPITTAMPLPPLPTVEELVQAIEEIRVKAAYLSQEQKDQLWHEHVEPFVKKAAVYKNELN